MKQTTIEEQLKVATALELPDGRAALEAAKLQALNSITPQKWEEEKTKSRALTQTDVEIINKLRHPSRPAVKVGDVLPCRC